MAELGAIVEAGEMILDDHDNSVFFPEGGLHLSLPAVKAVHGIKTQHRSEHALALEIATHGEPRSLAIVAIPTISKLGYFTQCLDYHQPERVPVAEYQSWRDSTIIRPTMCPCCVDAVQRRRENPEIHPMTRILSDAIERGISLHCQMVSQVLEFHHWITPSCLRFSEGTLGMLAEDSHSIMELDLGMCHAMRIVRHKMDDEVFSQILLYDSIGQLHLRIAARGKNLEKRWRDLCEG